MARSSEISKFVVRPKFFSFRTVVALFSTAIIAATSFSTFASQSEPAATTRELTAFEKDLMMRHSISTQETIVQHGSRKFRKVVYENETFYLALTSELASVSELTLLCGEAPAEFNRESTALIHASFRVVKRTRFFIEGLKTFCNGAKNKSRIDLAPEIAVGFQLDDSPDPKAFLKNRKITVNPLNIANGLGFSADW